jgi:hypothetical protein
MGSSLPDIFLKYVSISIQIEVLRASRETLKRVRL